MHRPVPDGTSQFQPVIFIHQADYLKWTASEGVEKGRPQDFGTGHWRIFSFCGIIMHKARNGNGRRHKWAPWHRRSYASLRTLSVNGHKLALREFFSLPPMVGSVTTPRPANRSQTIALTAYLDHKDMPRVFPLFCYAFHHTATQLLAAEMAVFANVLFGSLRR